MSDGYFNIPNWALFDAAVPLGEAQRSVIIAVCRWSNGEGRTEACLTIDQLAVGTKFSKQQIISAIKRLSGRGLLFCRVDDNGNHWYSAPDHA